jgi:hypothetical protein
MKYNHDHDFIESTNQSQNYDDDDYIFDDD